MGVISSHVASSAELRILQHRFHGRLENDIDKVMYSLVYLLSITSCYSELTSSGVLKVATVCVTRSKTGNAPVTRAMNQVMDRSRFF